MHGLEIHTAVEYDLPIVFVVFDNCSHAMCHVREEVFLGGKTGGQLFKPSRIAEGIKAMFPSIMAFEVENEAELTHALESIKNQKHPVCISVHISPEDYPPFIPFLN